ncbi:hypothetical protein HOI83_00330 [Candidatus Uhrbacteria bacterium]|jgi:hypothetical protein|nr:hypothetical protein [Candidatus Uhrbacteria bacterium]
MDISRFLDEYGDELIELDELSEPTDGYSNSETLFYTDTFQPLNMVADAIGQHVVEMHDFGIRGIKWLGAVVHGKMYEESRSAKFPVTHLGEVVGGTWERIRKIRVRAIGEHVQLGQFKAVAECKLFQHPDEGYGWEAGTVKLTWVREDNKEVLHQGVFRFTHKIVDKKIQTTVSLEK